MDKYLSAGQKEFHYIVNNGWAIHPAYNGDFVICSRTDLQDAAYNQNDELLDKTAGDVLKAKLSKPVQAASQFTLQQYIDEATKSIQDKNNVFCNRLIIDYPNVTKALATNLSKIHEAAIFNMTVGSLEFMCFAARKCFVNYLLLRTNLICVNPEYLYHCVPDHKNSFASFITDDVLVVHDKELTQMAVVGLIDYEKRLDFLTVL